MPRLPELVPETLSPEQRAVYDAVFAKRGFVPAPHTVWIRNPELGRLADGMGYYFQNNSSLPAHLYELTILLVARFWNVGYAWNTHAQRAAKAGIPENLIAELRRGDNPALSDGAPEAVIIRFVDALQREHTVGSDRYEEAKALLGQHGVIDLVGLVGYFTMLSATIATFEL